MVGSIALIVVLLSVFCVYRVAGKNVLFQEFPASVKDSQLIPDNYKETIAYLKENLGPDDQFVTMTNEISWYYFLDKLCPVRFPMAIMAAPDFYQAQFVDGLKKGHIKFILYRNKSWFSSIDGISTVDRLPIVFRYIDEHFRPFAVIDDQELWVPKDWKGTGYTPIDSASNPYRVELFKAKSDVLGKGWGEPQLGPEGLGFRFTTQATAGVTIQNDKSKANVSLKVIGFPAGAGLATGRILINGADAGQYRLDQVVNVVSVAKPASIIGDNLLDVQVVNDRLYVPDDLLHNGDIRQLGIGVVKVWQE
jgi:hypothetical protein